MFGDVIGNHWNSKVGNPKWDDVKDEMDVNGMSKGGLFGAFIGELVEQYNLEWGKSILVLFRGTKQNYSFERAGWLFL